MEDTLDVGDEEEASAGGMRAICGAVVELIVEAEVAAAAARQAKAKAEGGTGTDDDGEKHDDDNNLCSQLKVVAF